jgi:TRAP-type uncharacterized transport system substrate-binding protein
MVRPVGQIAIFSFLFGAIAIVAAASVTPVTAQVVEGYDLAKLPPESREKVRVNAGAVSILVSGSTCTCARLAEDIRNVVNDVNNPRPGGVRLVPVLGEGGLQNLKDTLFLRGINMAMVDESTLKALKQRNPRAYGDIDKKLRYITKLYDAEVHILATKDIKSVADLAGKTVNFDYKDSETDLIASRIFKALDIKVSVAYDDQRYALKRLLGGEIAAVAVSTGAPQEALARLAPGSGLHLLPLDETSLPGRNLRPILDEFLPTELTHAMYPNLIAEGQTVSTVASRVLLVIYNWEEDNVRYKRNAQFVKVFFSRIDEFRNAARHPKWRDVNLAAEVPGWTRFKPAQDWLTENRGRTAEGNVQTSEVLGNPEEQKTVFEEFLAKRAANDGKPISASERKALFSEFEKFLEHRNGRGAAR